MLIKRVFLISLLNFCLIVEANILLDDGLTEISKRGSFEAYQAPSTARLKRRQAIESSAEAIAQETYQPSTRLLKTTLYNAKEVANYLESHPAHSIHDPRAYFTEERTTRSLVIMLNELRKLPTKLRFAYVTRIFNELGRRLATKLNYYAVEVAAILKKRPDELGNKPDVSMLVDTINNAFESKEVGDVKEFEGIVLQDDTLGRIVSFNKEKSLMFNNSLVEIGQRLAHLLVHFTLEANRTSLSIPDRKRELMASMLSESLQVGCDLMIRELSTQDKYKVSDEVVLYTNKILQTATAIYKRHIKHHDSSVGSTVMKNFKVPGSFKNLNQISDKTGLIGPWNNNLFSNLGTSERVIKLFASLLTRVPVASKTRYINMYISQVNQELERTLSAFVYMQGMPYNKRSSEDTLLKLKMTAPPTPTASDFSKTSSAINALMFNLSSWQRNYSQDKNRIPARCYLAGRRWRLVLTRACHGYTRRDQLMKLITDKISQLKLRLAKKGGNEIYRLCLPRVEVGLKGYSINGEPEVDARASSGFPLKNPIDSLDMMKDPFTNGVELGYKIGVRVGYNEERNATLEMENNGRLDLSKKTKSSSATKAYMTAQIAKASYRRATTVGAKKAFEIAVHEGYLSALKVSLRAGIQITTETAAKMAAAKCFNFAGLVGRETGRSVAEKYLKGRRVSDRERERLIQVGQLNGKSAAQKIAETIGLLVGSKVAEEAYKRNLIRGGKLARAKFHLEEYEAGANLGFEYGLKEGKRIGSSASLDPSAPNYLRFSVPSFANDDGNDNQDVDQWQSELIPPIKNKELASLQKRRDHTLVSGSLRGIYKVAKEVKKGMDRVSYSNITYDLEVYASGFIMNDVAYLILNATVDKLGILRGSLIAKDIFNDRED